MFYLFYGFVRLISWLPFGVLFFFSDIFYFFAYHIVGYRKETVRKNLENAFPEKTIKERRKIERRFYRFFCDTFFETIKKLHISDDEMRKRFRFPNTGVILEQFDKGKDVIFMTAHYGNWEWFSSYSLHVNDKITVAQVYRKLKNEKFDKFMLELRSQFKTVNIEKKMLLRDMLRMKKEGKITVFGFLSDQSPNAASIHYVTRFLNQDTPTLTGAEQIARKFDYPAIYGRITRPKRGYYSCELVPISVSPKETEEFEITEKYMRLLEEDIKKCPEIWLWSHNRWKHAHNVTKP